MHFIDNAITKGMKMLIFRKFCIRKADVIEATLKDVSVNLHARQAAIIIRAKEDKRAEMRMDLTADEVERLLKLLRIAFAGINGDADAPERLSDA